MAVNQIAINGTVELDLTGDTVTASSLLIGYTAHDKSGTEIVGELETQVVRSGINEPSNSLGDNGDLYLVLEG